MLVMRGCAARLVIPSGHKIAKMFCYNYRRLCTLVNELEDVANTQIAENHFIFP